MFYHYQLSICGPNLAESFPTEYFLKMEAKGKTENPR